MSVVKSARLFRSAMPMVWRRILSSRVTVILILANLLKVERNGSQALDQVICGFSIKVDTGASEPQHAESNRNETLKVT